MSWIKVGLWLKGVGHIGDQTERTAEYDVGVELAVSCDQEHMKGALIC